ncbi:MAG: flagellar export chaperone FliS [Myxococcota bacterium]
MNAARRYVVTQSQTASRERLLVMLLHAAQRNLRAAATALESGPHGVAAPALERSSAIIQELLSTLDHRTAPELSAGLAAVYEFILQRITLAMASRNVCYVHEAERAFNPIAAGFEEAVEKLGSAG